MGILSDKSIRERIENGSIGVEPLRDIDEQVQPGSLDIRLGHEYKNKEIEDEANAVQYANPGESIVFEPNTFYLAHTLEEISLPEDVCAQLTGRSTYGRAGLMMHVSAGWIDPGFTGTITLEVYNFSNTEIAVPVENRVAQVVFHELDDDAETPYGQKDDAQYQGQSGVEDAEILEDE